MIALGLVYLILSLACPLVKETLGFTALEIESLLFPFAAGILITRQSNLRGHA